MNKISTKELTQFLNDANKSTYANKDAPKATPTRLNSEDYHYESGDLIYHDTYFGGRDFIGEEIVYKNDKPVWGENYFGFVLDDNVSEKEVYGFLREALMEEYEDRIPVRGPSSFSNGDKEYKFSVDGDLRNFRGEETISFGGKIVYHCFVHGGFIR